MENMDDILQKAQVLVEALPYIQRFNRKIIVVKYGGSAMLDEKLQQSVIKDVALLKLVGMQPIIVHGGGKEISKWLGYMGKESEFVEGLRVTDADTMEVAEMVLSKVNKHLVQMMEKLGVKAAGISGKASEGSRAGSIYSILGDPFCGKSGRRDHRTFRNEQCCTDGG